MKELTEELKNEIEKKNEQKKVTVPVIRIFNALILYYRTTWKKGIFQSRMECLITSTHSTCCYHYSLTYFNLCKYAHSTTIYVYIHTHSLKLCSIKQEIFHLFELKKLKNKKKLFFVSVSFSDRLSRKTTKGIGDILKNELCESRKKNFVGKCHSWLLT